MELFEIVFLHMLMAGISGAFALWYMSAMKLTTESIDSPTLVTRWLYRYLIFSFWFLASFLLVAPFTTWQLIKLQNVHEYSKNQPWLVFALNLPPAMLLYYLHRKFAIWSDPAKIRNRKSRNEITNSQPKNRQSIR